MNKVLKKGVSAVIGCKQVLLVKNGHLLIKLLYMLLPMAQEMMTMSPGPFLVFHHTMPCPYPALSVFLLSLAIVVTWQLSQAWVQKKLRTTPTLHLQARRGGGVSLIIVVTVSILYT